MAPVVLLSALNNSFLVALTYAGFIIPWCPSSVNFHIFIFLTFETVRQNEAKLHRKRLCKDLNTVCLFFPVGTNMVTFCDFDFNCQWLKHKQILSSESARSNEIIFYRKHLGKVLHKVFLFGWFFFWYIKKLFLIHKKTLLLWYCLAKGNNIWKEVPVKGF